MRTPLDAFHGALLGLVAQKRAEEVPPPRKKRRRQAAAGVVGEHVIWWPPKNHIHAAHGAYKMRAKIVSIAGDKAVLDIGIHAQLRHLDADCSLDDEIDDAIASIRATLEGGA